MDTFSVAGHRVVAYLPAVYNAEPQGRFPVVYFLHGFPGNPEQWFGSGAQLPAVLDQLIDDHKLPPLIAVMPDGNGVHLSDTEWGNTAAGDRVETWLVNRVVSAVDARYGGLGATYRGIAGFSAGGFGAVNLAVRHPSVFRWAASWSGLFTARSDIFGAAAKANSPQLTGPHLPVAQRMPLYVADGEGDLDFRAETQRFVATLRQAGWSPLKAESVGGGHGWEAWRAEMVDSLVWLGALWGPHPG
jgi:enterochelin esterase-like enzyme